jgi:hypothetical protein
MKDEKGGGERETGSGKAGLRYTRHLLVSGHLQLYSPLEPFSLPWTYHHSLWKRCLLLCMCTLVKDAKFQSPDTKGLVTDWLQVMRSLSALQTV